MDFSAKVDTLVTPEDADRLLESLNAVGQSKYLVGQKKSGEMDEKEAEALRAAIKKYPVLTVQSPFIIDSASQRIIVNKLRKIADPHALVQFEKDTSSTHIRFFWQGTYGEF